MKIKECLFTLLKTTHTYQWVSLLGRSTVSDACRYRVSGPYCHHERVCRHSRKQIIRPNSIAGRFRWFFLAQQMIVIGSLPCGSWSTKLFDHLAWIQTGWLWPFSLRNVCSHWFHVINLKITLNAHWIHFVMEIIKKSVALFRLRLETEINYGSNQTSGIRKNQVSSHVTWTRTRLEKLESLTRIIFSFVKKNSKNFLFIVKIIEQGQICFQNTSVNYSFRFQSRLHLAIYSSTQTIIPFNKWRRWWYVHQFWSQFWKIRQWLPMKNKNDAVDVLQSSRWYHSGNFEVFTCNAVL